MMGHKNISCYDSGADGGSVSADRSSRSDFFPGVVQPLGPLKMLVGHKDSDGLLNYEIGLNCRGPFDGHRTPNGQ